MKNVIFLVAFLLFNGLLSAQRTERPNNDRQGGMSIETMVTELGLTADQKQRIEKIQATAQEKRKALRNQSLTEDQRREQLRQIGKESRDSMNEVLTDEQKAKMQAAKGRKGGKERAQLTPETREKVQSYKKENIKPSREAARSELEQKISAADRQEIDRLRAVMATNPVVSKRKQKGAKGGQGKELTPAEREAIKTEAKAWKEANAADLAAVKQLVEKYRSDMKPLLANLATEREQWKADLQEITAVDRAKQAAATAPKQAERGGRGKGKTQDSQARDDKQMTHFLLMKPKA